MPRTLHRQQQNPDAYRDAEHSIDGVLINGKDPGAARRAQMRANTARMQRADEEARGRHAGKTVAGQLMNSLSAQAAGEKRRRDAGTPRPV